MLDYRLYWTSRHTELQVVEKRLLLVALEQADRMALWFFLLLPENNISYTGINLLLLVMCELSVIILLILFTLLFSLH